MCYAFGTPPSTVSCRPLFSRDGRQLRRDRAVGLLYATLDRMTYCGCMEVHFTPEQEAEVARVAAIVHQSEEDFVKNAALRLLDDAEFLAAVQKGIDEADRGEFIEEEEMDARIEKMLRT
jgi:predicted transcriptional regulator